MKVFVTGLCMQGNKGGPALALSLAYQITKYRKNAQFVFSVPRDKKEYELEKVWADKYGFKVVKSVGGKHIVPPFCFSSGRFKVFQKWANELKEADVLLEMSAICYVGPPINTARGSIGRHILFWLAKRYNRPMIPWTQSYGPFSTWIIRLMARIDLSSNSIVFCRGDNCRIEVQKLLPEIKAMSFPDVATILPYDRKNGLNYLAMNIKLKNKRFFSISPSAVLYSRTDVEASDNKHVRQMKELCLYLSDLGYDVLLVPHSLYPNKPTPNKCDYMVCEEIKSLLGDRKNIHIVKDNLSPVELKSIISNAAFHIGARYHSVVAALSSGVPAISLSWHPKYKDLMTTFNMGNFVFDAVSQKNLDELISQIDVLIAKESTIKNSLEIIQCEVSKEVDRNTELWLDIYSRKKNDL